MSKPGRFSSKRKKIVICSDAVQYLSGILSWTWTLINMKELSSDNTLELRVLVSTYKKRLQLISQCQFSIFNLKDNEVFHLQYACNACLRQILRLHNVLGAKNI